MSADSVAALLASGAGVHRWWGEEYRRNIPRLADEVRALWAHLGLLRVAPGYTDRWWLSPAVARWAAPKEVENTSEGQNT